MRWIGNKLSLLIAWSIRFIVRFSTLTIYAARRSLSTPASRCSTEQTSAGTLPMKGTHAEVVHTLLTQMTVPSESENS